MTLNVRNESISDAAEVAQAILDDEARRTNPVHAYCEWLYNEIKMLNREMGYGPSTGISSPCGTIGGDFHFPADGRSWRDIPPPSSRATTVLRILGVLPADADVVGVQA